MPATKPEYDVNIISGGVGSNVTIAGPVDGSGYVEVAQQGSVTVAGGAANGAAVTGNPVLIAGSDGTDVRTVRVGTNGHVHIVGASAAGAAITGDPVAVGGSDGTNAQYLSVDTSGQANVNVKANAIPSAGYYGQATVAATAAQLTATSHTLTGGLVTLTAPTGNTGTTYIGFDSSVTTGNGRPLEAGKETVIFIDDPSLIYIIGTASDIVGWTAS